MLRQLSPADSAMLHMETPATPNHISPILIFDQKTAPGGKVTFKGVLAKLDAALDEAPNFRRKMLRVPLDLDEPYWVDDPHFDIEFHARRLALPKPGDWRQFCIQVARLLSRPLDAGRPLWEVYVIEGLDHVEGLAAGSFALLFKIHHSMVDGMGMMALMNAILDPEPETKKPKVARDFSPERGPTRPEMLFRAWRGAVLNPGRTMARAARHAPAIVREGAAAMRARREGAANPPVPKSMLTGDITQARVFDARFCKLSDIKRLRSVAEGVTVNDAALAIIGGALRRYLLAHGALPEDSLVASVPISIKSKDAKANPSGNEITARNVAIGTDIEDAKERLIAISRAMTEVKAASNTLRARALIEMSADMPGAIAGTMGRAMAAVAKLSGHPGVANVVVSNVPGLQKPMYLAGAKLVRFCAGGPLVLNFGVLFAIVSFCDELSIGLTACRDRLPDPDLFMQGLDESLAEHLALQDASVVPLKARRSPAA